MNDLLGIDTPFIFIERDIVEHNIAKMQGIANGHGKKLRPHIKTHKVPLVAQWQMEAGAVGICVQKTSEAEVMAHHGIRDILISNEVIGKEKTDRIARLATSNSRISIAVDSELGVKQISDSSREAGSEIGVYIDVDVGMERCGVRGDSAGELAKTVAKSPNLHFLGVMGYDGHSAGIADLQERRKAVSAAWSILDESIKSIKASGSGVDVISVGGTPSSPIWAEMEGVNELQPGTYVYNDAHQVELGVATRGECGLRLMATVMSKANDYRAVVDAGSKSFAFDKGAYPFTVEEIGGRISKFSEEHGVIKSTDKPLRVELGDRLTFIPYHACTIVDLWDSVYLSKSGRSLGELTIEARAART